MASRWGDPLVARALGDVVARLGRRALQDPARIEAGLVDELGGITGSMARQIDALVVAVEANVPESMLAGVPALDLSESLDGRGMAPDAAGWVLSTWGWVLAEQRDRWAESGQEWVGEPQVLPGRRTGIEPDAPTAPVPARGSRRRRRRGVLIGAAAGLVVLLAAAVAAVAAFTTSRTDARGPLTRPALAGGSATPVPTVAVPGAITGGVVVLARAGGSERYPPGTSPAFLDAVKAQTPKGLRAAVTADLRWTADDVPVLIEDARIAPPMYCARRYAVARVTWSTLLSSCLTRASASSDRRSYPVASLSSTLQKISAVTGGQLFLQIKTPLTGRQRQILLMQIGQTRMSERVVICSFDPSDLKPFRAGALPDGMALRLMLFRRSASLTGTTARQDGYWAVAVRRTAATASYVRGLHAAGVRVAAWNLDDRAGWDAARSAGVDIVVSNTPRAYLSWAEPG